VFLCPALKFVAALLYFDDEVGGLVAMMPNRGVQADNCYVNVVNCDG
jgi:hypothetical protein